LQNLKLIIEMSFILLKQTDVCIVFQQTCAIELPLEFVSAHPERPIAWRFALSHDLPTIQKSQLDGEKKMNS
jgi:hypothetical protein